MGQTWGWNRDVTSTDCHPLVIIDGTDEIQHIVVVIKWFSNSHDNNMTDTLVLTTLIKVFLNQHDLRYNLTVIKVTLLLNQAWRTEGTTNITSDLSGHTDWQTVVLTHQHSLNQHAIWQLEKILNSTVSWLLYNPLFQRIDHKLLIELSNQILGKVGHFFKGLDTFTVEPFPDLICSEFLFSLF